MHSQNNNPAFLNKAQKIIVHWTKCSRHISLLIIERDSAIDNPSNMGNDHNAPASQTRGKYFESHN